MALVSKSKSRSVSLPAPVGGWNARDSLAEMPATDAVIMNNWFPLTTECMLRKGYTQFATGFPAPVESLMVYSGGGSTEELWAAANGSLYDATSGGAIGAAAVSGLTNARWQYCNVATAGGNFLYIANGVDTPYLYDGSTWTSITGVSTPAITGVTTTELNNPIVFKSRVWFVQRNTLKTWYLPAISVGGAANAVDMSAVAQLGGYIVDHATWTIDAGQGVDDYYVAVTSMGEIIVYQGTDPSDATKWALRGVWRLGQPVGSRCLFKLGGDLLLICQDGLLPLGAALQSSRVNPRVALTDKIQYAVSSAISSYGGNFGWQVFYFPRENQLWMNVPVSEGSNQQQYVMNTITKSWANFSGMEANCWVIFQEAPYFGGSNFVGSAWNGNTDDVSDITATSLQAFNGFGAPGLYKRFTMTKPIFRTNGAPSLLSSMNIDFDTSMSTAPLSFSATSYAAWDGVTALWDSAYWGGDLSVIQNWQSVTGFGYYGAPQMKVSSSGIDVRWVTTDVVYETGAIL